MIFTKKQVQQFKNAFVDNECDTDEYRWTQPVKGLYMLTHFEEVNKEVGESLEFLDYGDEIPNIEEVINALKGSDNKFANSVGEWLESAQFGCYSGSDGLKPLLERLFDSLWASGSHPYYEKEELVELINEGFFEV